jgi:ABC-type polysaccharide/polyol phosphate export permease
MNRTRVLYHLVRADFLERVRRYNFLVTLAFAVYLGYCCVTGKVVIRLDEYRGVYNSAWVGCLMALVATMFLSLIGFYIVKNTIQRDQETRVGQILATTPITKSFYTVAKMISNFAVLATMVAVMAIAAVVMQWLKAEDSHVHLWELLSPFLIFALPAVAFTAGLAVLFENLPGLRGGAGNVIYFFVWTALLAAPAATLDKGGRVGEGVYFRDFSGIVSVMSQMQQDLRSIDPAYKNGAALTIGDTATSKRFLWSGLRGTPALYWSRVTCVMAAIALALLAAVFFHRFDPAREWRLKKPPAENHAAASVEAPALPAQTAAHLTPVTHTASATSLLRLVPAELKLMLKGHRWWWYAGAGIIFIATMASPLDAARGGVALAALIWPVLVWSQMGTREARFNTASLVFSAEHSIHRQLPAIWIAGVGVTAATNGGLAIRLLIAGDHQGLLSWIVCTLFVPSLALALGLWSGTSRFFEAVYTAWWYIGPAHHTPGLDFLGTTAQSARPETYLLMTAALVVAAYLGRRAKIAYA